MAGRTKKAARARVIVGARQRLLEHRAPSGIWRDHASIALPPVFLIGKPSSYGDVGKAPWGRRPIRRTRSIKREQVARRSVSPTSAVHKRQQSQLREYIEAT